MSSTRRGISFFLAAAVLLVILATSVESVRLYVDWLFFQETGFSSVFRRTILAKLAAGLSVGLAAFLILIVNALIAARSSFPRPFMPSFGNQFTPLARVDLGRLAGPGSFVLTLIVSVFAFMIGTGFWEEMILFVNSQPSGLADPVFGKDISFYFFVYPFLVTTNAAISQILVLAFVVTALCYVLRGGVSFTEGLLTVAPRVKRHLGILVSLVILTLAAKFYLDRYGVLTNDHGIIFGASYTDIHARLPVLLAMSLLAAGCAVAFLVGVMSRSYYPLLITVGILVAAYVLGLKVYPTLLQNVRVSPNEIVLEKPYIERHIGMTREGYGLESIRTEAFDVSETLSAGDIRKNISTIDNIRLWDEDPLLKTYSQLQQIRTYYKFIDVDNDRYTVNGRYLQVMLSPREMSYEDLPGRSWINEHLIYTHGFGLAMGPVSGITREGLPEFIIKDIPPETTSNVRVTRPEIYFGENPNEFVVIKTAQKEFSYPTSEENVYSTYEGSGGVALSSYFRRMIFALHFQSYKLLLSGDISSESRIMYNRDIRKRVASIAPFLLFDPDPYMVISQEGNLYWIIDAYTYSGSMPYSKPIQQGINYIRNPVKVVVDAYNGDVAFYIVDDSDVLVRTYAKIFPGLFKPAEAMPQDLRQHIRYPRSLLKIQAQMYSTFHMTDPNVFYNKEDLWEIPSYRDRTMEPYYLIMKLPDGQAEEFVLLLPFTPSKRDNLAAWMAARCDGDNYGRIIVYTFPRDRLIFGPRQIDARIDQDAFISQQLTLWGQRGSEVIRGSLLIIPIERSLIYTQPLYLVATDRVGLPELRRVIAAHGNDVVMEETLQAAIQRLFQGTLPRQQTPKAAPPETLPRSWQEIRAAALQNLEKARESLRSEDWAGFGRYLGEAERLLKEVQK